MHARVGCAANGTCQPLVVTLGHGTERTLPYCMSAIGARRRHHQTRLEYKKKLKLENPHVATSLTHAHTSTRCESGACCVLPQKGHYEGEDRRTVSRSHAWAYPLALEPYSKGSSLRTDDQLLIFFRSRPEPRLGCESTWPVYKHLQWLIAGGS
jgi:hypothetical protein